MKVKKELAKIALKITTGIDLDKIPKKARSALEEEVLDKIPKKARSALEEFSDSSDDSEQSGLNEDSSPNISNEKDGKGKKGNSQSVMGISKIVFKSGIIIAVAVFILCVVMTVITMFTSITGTVVQIIDGTIYDYGEPTEEEKNAKKKKSSAEYDGDELYMKLKMIVAAVENDNSLKKKVDKVKVPNSVPGDLRQIMNGKKRGGNYNIIQIGYLMKEFSMTSYAEKFKLNDGTTVKIDWRAPLGSFCQENDCGASMESSFPSVAEGGWLSAHVIDSLGGAGTPGPFQMQNAYFTPGGYRVFIPTLEKDNGTKYGVVSKRKDSLKSMMKYNKNSRMNTNGSSLNGYHFSDLIASAAQGLCWNSGTEITSWWKSMAKKGGADVKECEPMYSIALFEMVHRGGGFFTKGSIWYSNDVTKVLAEMAADGLLTEDNLLKYIPKVANGSKWIPYREAFVKKNSIYAKADADNKCNTGVKCTVIAAKYGDGFKPSGGNNVPRDLYTSPIYKIFLGLRCGKEIEALADAAFDKLGLTLPTSGGGTMELKETKGKFQGFWSDKNGKTLSSDEMLTYKSAGNKGGQKNSKLVGMKEDSATTVKYTNDPFKKKFGDNIGVIWYHQTSHNSWGGFLTHPNAGTGNTLVKSFCGGYSTSIVLSTMLHRYINPPEIIYAAHSYDKRHGTSGAMKFENGQGKFISENQTKLIKEQMYKGKALFKVTADNPGTQAGKSNLSKTKLNSTLDAGGLVIACFDKGIASGTGHFVVIRSRDSSGNYYLADPSHNNNKEVKKVNHKFNWDYLEDHCKNQLNYIEPGPGYKKYIEDFSTSSSSSSSGSVGGGNYKYWVQFTSSAGKHGNITSTCPKQLSAGCFAYSALKICKLLGADFKAKTVLNKCISSGILSSNGACNNNNGLLEATGLKGYTMESISIDNIDFSTKSGKKKLAKKISEYQKKGSYVFVHMGQKNYKHHFVNMFSNDGKNIEVWDSGTWQSQGSWSKFLSHYKPKKDTWVNSLRVVKKSK